MRTWEREFRAAYLRREITKQSVFICLRLNVVCYGFRVQGFKTKIVGAWRDDAILKEGIDVWSEL